MEQIGTPPDKEVAYRAGLELAQLLGYRGKTKRRHTFQRQVHVISEGEYIITETETVIEERS